MEHSMRIYAIQAAKIGVNCNVVIPGAVRTEAWDRLSKKVNEGKSTNKDILMQVSKRVPLGGSPMDPTHIGDVVSFLSKPDTGGRYITGQSLPVDAGFSMTRL